MELGRFDGRRVRIVSADGEVYEGLAYHNNADYNYHEFGSYEEGLEISNCLFYRSDIKEIEEIEEFSAPYGRIEETVLEDGADMALEALECDGDDDTACRMIACIAAYLKDGRDFPDREEIVSAVKDLLLYSDSERIKDAARAVIK
ncbi:MAG: hypothetical protein IKN38_08360 [Clostridia bacterium]|nr:hypothetical protein [Clostridia bacterium]